MNKIIAIIVCAILLSSCKTLTKTEYLDKPIPIYLTPIPAEITKPVYAIDELSEEDKKDHAKLSKAIAKTAAQKNGYIEQLELVYNTYKKLGEDSLLILEKLKKIDPKMDLGEVTDISYMNLLKSTNLYIDSLNKNKENEK